MERDAKGRLGWTEYSALEGMAARNGKEGARTAGKMEIDPLVWHYPCFRQVPRATAMRRGCRGDIYPYGQTAADPRKWKTTFAGLPCGAVSFGH